MNIVELNKILKTVCNKVPTVNSYYSDDVYEVWNTTEVKYASMAFNLQNTKQTDHTRTFEGVLYYADRLTEDKTNRLGIYADADNAIANVLYKLQDSVEEGEFNISDFQITHFQQKFADYLAGGYATISITVANTCDVVLLQETIERTITITENGVYDVTNYTTAEVNVIPQWGTIEGNINEQEDLIELINGKVNPLESRIENVEEVVAELGDFTCGAIEPTTTNFVEGTEYTIHEALQRTANLFGGIQGEIDDINAKIPNQATSQNQLADKDFVNSTIATNAANFRGSWTTWVNVPLTANDYPEDYVGNRTPTNNDYMVVQDASGYSSADFNDSFTIVYQTRGNNFKWTYNGATHSAGYYQRGTLMGPNDELSVKTVSQVNILKSVRINDVIYTAGEVWHLTANEVYTVYTTTTTQTYEGQWRFQYVGDWDTNGKLGWHPQYQIGSSFTAAQQAAIDSTITATKVATYDGYGTAITALQTDKLDKNYTADKIYGTDSLGAQTVYTLGNGLAFDNGQIVCNINPTIPEETVGNDVLAKTLEPNKVYIFESRTNNLTLTLGTATSGIVNEYHMFIYTGETAPVITFPSGISWVGIQAPIISTNKTYEVSILNNLAVLLQS